MVAPKADDRSPTRQGLDEQIAAEPPLAPLDLPADAPRLPVAAHMQRRRGRPVAVAGVVENGLVRPVDSAVKLPEHARVIIVATEAP